MDLPLGASLAMPKSPRALGFRCVGTLSHSWFPALSKYRQVSARGTPPAPLPPNRYRAASSDRYVTPAAVRADGPVVALCVQPFAAQLYSYVSDWRVPGGGTGNTPPNTTTRSRPGWYPIAKLTRTGRLGEGARSAHV